MVAVPTCFVLLRQEIARAFSRAWANTGKRIAARIAMIAITTSSSIRVKPPVRRIRFLLILERSTASLRIPTNTVSAPCARRARFGTEGSFAIRGVLPLYRQEGDWSEDRGDPISHPGGGVLRRRNAPGTRLHRLHPQLCPCLLKKEITNAEERRFLTLACRHGPCRRRTGRAWSDT